MLVSLYYIHRAIAHGLPKSRAKVDKVSWAIPKKVRALQNYITFVPSFYFSLFPFWAHNKWGLILSDRVLSLTSKLKYLWINRAHSYKLRSN